MLLDHTLQLTMRRVLISRTAPEDLESIQSLAPAVWNQLFLYRGLQNILFVFDELNYVGEELVFFNLHSLNFIRLWNLTFKNLISWKFLHFSKYVFFLSGKHTHTHYSLWLITFLMQTCTCACILLVSTFLLYFSSFCSFLMLLWDFLNSNF